MKAPVLLNLVRDLAVALDASKGRSAGRELVALGAIGRAIQLLVGPRQRAGRYLRVSNFRGGDKEKYREMASQRPRCRSTFSCMERSHYTPGDKLEKDCALRLTHRPFLTVAACCNSEPNVRYARD